MERTNRLAWRTLTALSSVALLSVLTGYLPGHGPQPDEGTAAHIFQLAILATVPVMMAFVGTADWTRPAHQTRRLALPIAAIALSFVALYYLEHVWYAPR
jgi:hypothetical protein